MAKSEKPEKKTRTVEEVKAGLRERVAVEPPDFEHGLSIGSVLLNLACTGRPDVALLPGTYNIFIGDKNSGKSLFSMTAFAEAAANPVFDDYEFIYDGGEDGLQMDIAKSFGSRVASRLRAPRYDGKRPRPSVTIEDFYHNLDDCLKVGPCIYVVDSIDVLTSVAEQEHFKKRKNAIQKKAKKIPGSYGDGKARTNSSNLRQMINPLKETKSILLVINQTRDNLSSPFGGKTHSGGNALTFLSQNEIWSKVLGKINQEVRDKDRHIGNYCQMHVRRSRYTGHEAKVTVPIYFSTGIDDTGACVDYLIEEGHWKVNRGRFAAPEFDTEGTAENVARHIEQIGGEKKLAELVTAVWKDIEAKSAEAVVRKKRYT